MKALLFTLTLCTLTLCTGSTPALAQQPASNTGGNQALTEIAQSLDKIVRLLNDQTEVQRSAILLERLRIESEELTAAEEPLRRLTDQRDGIDQQIRMISVQLDAEEQRLFRDGDRLSADAQDELDKIRREFDGMLTRLQDEKARVVAKLIDAENELHDRRVRLETLRARVDEILGIDGN